MKSLKLNINIPNELKILITFEKWADLCHGTNGTQPRVLTNGKFHEKEGNTTHEEHDEIWDQKGTCSLYCNYK